MGLFSPSVTSRNIHKADKALEAITEDDKLVKAALNKKVHPAIREAAIEKISDEIILARTITNPLYASLSVQHVCPRIHSQAALDIIHSFISGKQTLPWNWKKRKALQLLRLLDDPVIQQKVFEAEKEDNYQISFRYGSEKKEAAEAYAEMLEDAVKLKKLGENPQILLSSLLSFQAEYPRRLVDRTIQEMLSDQWSVELLRNHMNDPKWIGLVKKHVPEEIVLEAFPKDDPDRKQMLSLFQIVDGEYFQSKCDFDEHDYKLIKVETEENHEDCNHPYTYSYFECSRCGKRYKIMDDGWGREYRSDRW